MLPARAGAAVPAAAQSPFDPARDSVARILQTPAVDGGGYARYNFPRADLKVTIGDVTLAPGTVLRVRLDDPLLVRP